MIISMLLYFAWIMILVGGAALLLRWTHLGRPKQVKAPVPPESPRRLR